MEILTAILIVLGVIFGGALSCFLKSLLSSIAAFLCHKDEKRQKKEEAELRAQGKKKCPYRWRTRYRQPPCLEIITLEEECCSACIEAVNTHLLYCEFAEFLSKRNLSELTYSDLIWLDRQNKDFILHGSPLPAPESFEQWRSEREEDNANV